MLFFIRIIAAIGLICISGGVVVKNRFRQNILFTVGGICLLAYSVFLRDPIFIPLQIIFIIASIFELYKLKK